MQVNQPKEGGAEHNALEPLRPTMASHPLTPSTCEICGQNRATRKHQLCSRIRQRRWAAEWAAYQAEVAANKAQERRRYAR
ncbi:hypothetical protein [Stutzerimonas stutzeri]|uniref:Uncharacterized protein n=1 Tax=Stutzerimonas stutzeri TaxID=316 RepID=A0A6I6LYK9_STUST|nr:hypothetical protein [Stutzerimonas stutzeri]QGZ31461.1 hypothetical protein GQA94_15830 [Stutzerimonas stutzeri]